MCVKRTVYAYCDIDDKPQIGSDLVCNCRPECLWIGIGTASGRVIVVRVPFGTSARAVKFKMIRIFDSCTSILSVVSPLERKQTLKSSVVHDNSTHKTLDTKHTYNTAGLFYSFMFDKYTIARSQINNISKTDSLISYTKSTRILCYLITVVLRWVSNSIPRNSTTTTTRSWCCLLHC